jgi:hypothetical protein
MYMLVVVALEIAMITAFSPPHKYDVHAPVSLHAPCCAARITVETVQHKTAAHMNRCRRDVFVYH